MDYICFNRFKQNALCGEVNIPYGTKLDETNNVIRYCGSPICYIKSYAFGYCYGMRYYDFSACTAIPALPNKNAFNNIQSDCQMLIPSALYNNWKSATNWTTYASYMVSV